MAIAATIIHYYFNFRCSLHPLILPNRTPLQTAHRATSDYLHLLALGFYSGEPACIRSSS